MKDTRDLRDPSQFPDLSAAFRKFLKHTHINFHRFVDEVVGDRLNDVPNYPKHESMQTEQTRRYQSELEERAANGDIYAQSLRAGQPWDEPVA